MCQSNQILTIGIPTRNRPEMLSELLDDIVNCHQKFHIIISDNSNNDSTYKVTKKYSDSLNIQYLHVEQPLSQAENFNYMLEYASTPYVVMMHDDDRLMPKSLSSYLSLIHVLESAKKEVLATYVLAYKFRNSKELLDIFSSSKQLSCDEIQTSMKVFEKHEYLEYFVEKGIGGKAPGVLLNWELMKRYQLYFPTDTGAKHDKAFFLTANTIGCVAFLQKKVIAKRLHSERSIHKEVTKNYILLNQKLSELYQSNHTALRKVHRKRFEKWMQAEPSFRPIDCFSLLAQSQISMSEKLAVSFRYFLHHFFRLIYS